VTEFTKDLELAQEGTIF
jgi:hypothetical protein